MEHKIELIKLEENGTINLGNLSLVEYTMNLSGIPFRITISQLSHTELTHDIILSKFLDGSDFQLVRFRVGLNESKYTVTKKQAETILALFGVNAKIESSSIDWENIKEGTLTSRGVFKKFIKETNEVLVINKKNKAELITKELVCLEAKDKPKNYALI